MTNRYTVIGQPIAHSVSPAIHHRFGELTQRSIEYTRTEASDESFAGIVKNWQASGAKGCNVTAPFKQSAATVCDQLNETAKLAGAVNTIEMQANGTLVGHNTDGSGLLRDIEINKNIRLENKRILMVGAGGAARGTIASLLSSKPASLHIANRTVTRAAELAKLFSHLGKVTFSSYDDLGTSGSGTSDSGTNNAESQNDSVVETMAFDVIINATSMAFDGEAPPLPKSILNTNPFVYDLAYSAKPTPFLNWCEQCGVSERTDGFGMLVEQAADAFFIWEGVRPDTHTIFLAANDIINSAP